MRRRLFFQKIAHLAVVLVLGTSAWSGDKNRTSCIEAALSTRLANVSSIQADKTEVSVEQRLQRILAQLEPGHPLRTGTSHSEPGVKVVMAAVELGAIPGLKTTTGVPLNISAGGAAVVLNDIGRHYPALLSKQNSGELTLVGILMDKMSTEGMTPSTKIKIKVDGKNLDVGSWEYWSPSGAKYVFLDHPLFKRFSAVPENGQSIYYMRPLQGENASISEQKVWSVFNQAIAAVFKREKGDIYVPHDNHASPAAFYIHKRQGLDPVSSKPLVHNEGYSGSFTVQGSQIERARKIWNLTPSEMNEYFMHEDQLVMLAPSVRIAEQNEIYTAISVSEGSANKINQAGSIGPVDFFGRAGSQLNALGEENRPWLNPALKPATEAELRSDGITHPDVVARFKSKGFQFGFPGQSKEKIFASKALAKEAVQKTLGLDINPDKPVFISFARLVHQKGMTFAIKNIEYILNQGGQVVIGGPVGDTFGVEERRMLLALQKKLKDESNPHLKDLVFIDGMVKGRLKALLLAGGDFFMIPSRYEPCGLTDAEALYSGVIPIAHNVGGLSKGKNTILYGPTHPDDQSWELGKAINEAIDRYRDRSAFQERQYAAMQEKFSIEKNFSKFLLNNRIEVYGKLMRELDRQVDQNLISPEAAREKIRALVFDRNPKDVDPLIEALNQVHSSRQSPLMQWLVDQQHSKISISKAKEDQLQYEYSRLRDLKRSDQFEYFEPGKTSSEKILKSQYQPAQGWRDFHRDSNGHVVSGRFRFLANNKNALELNGKPPNVRFYVVGDFNHWGNIPSDALEKFRLRPIDQAYLMSDDIPLHHGAEYRILKRELKSEPRGSSTFVDTSLTDPANNAYTTPGLLRKMGLNVHDHKNSMFWDMDGPDHYHPQATRPDWRAISGGGLMLETDLAGLVKKWKYGEQTGPLSEIETYNYVTNSGIIPFLAKRGIRRIKFLPINEHVEGDGWQWSYQTYPFAIDCHKGSPAEFAKMVDAFNKNGIAVILDEVTGHFPLSGNPGMRAIDHSGLHLHTKEDGSRVYGHGGKTEWDTVPYDDSNPYVIRYKNDATLSHVMHYGIGGVRIDNVSGGIDTGIYHRAGGPDYLRQLNLELHSFDPGIYTNGEGFSVVEKIARSASLSDGLGFNSVNHGHLQNWIESNLGRFTGDLDMRSLEEVIDRPYREGQAARTTYFTNHDMSDNGSAFPAQIVYGPQGGGRDYAVRKSKAFGSLSLLMASDHQTMLQAELGQLAHFADGVVNWDLLKIPENKRLFAYWGELNRYFSENPAFNNRNDFISPLNHLDQTEKVISFWRTDSQTGKKVLAVVNLGDRQAEVGGISNYPISIPEDGSYRVVLDSEAKSFGGVSQLKSGQRIQSDDKSLVIPQLKPYEVLIFEKDSK